MACGRRVASKVASKVASGIGIAVVLLCLADAHAGDPLRFRSESGRFLIGFPGGAPQRVDLSAEKFTLTTNNVQHLTRVDDARFAVEMHDIPRAASMFLSDEFVIEQAVRGMLDDMGGRELRSDPTERQNQPARRVAFELPDSGMRGDLLLVLAKRRLYLVTTVYPAQSEPPVPFDRYVDSFEFWLE